MKKIEHMTPQEQFQEALKVNNECRQYVQELTERFFVSVKKDHDFSLSAKMDVVRRFPPYWMEFYIKRVKRLERYAKARGYNCCFGKWVMTREYAWTFTLADR